MLKIRSIDSVDALKMAIQCKIDMKNFYEKASTLVKNDDAVAILKGLAEKEEAHRQRLIKIYSKLSGKKILYLNLGRKHKLNTLVKCEDDPNEAVRAAKKNEAEIRNFLVTISRRLYEADLRQFFRQLAMEEEQHLALLESSFEEPLNLDEEATREDGDNMREIASADRDQVKTW